MKIQEKELDDIIVLSLDGHLLGEPETTEVRECVSRVLKRGKSKVVLDLSKVTKINSSGLGTLMSVLGSIRKKKGDSISRTLPSMLELCSHSPSLSKC